ncbi:hypothetical protein, partial [Heminiphilus faecis]|uniref:hypothetical protein n=1 Tax=Heminiphilus faecis TaxID=2601703 RepID=UPI00196882AE
PYYWRPYRHIRFSSVLGRADSPRYWAIRVGGRRTTGAPTDTSDSHRYWAVRIHHGIGPYGWAGAVLLAPLQTHRYWAEKTPTTKAWSVRSMPLSLVSAEIILRGCP